MKKVIGIISIIVIAGLALFFFGIEGVSKTDKDIDKHLYSKGEVAKLDGVKMSVENAEFVAPDDLFEVEDVGKKVLMVDVEFKNKSEQDIVVMPENFKLYDREGDELSSYIGYDDVLIEVVEKGKTVKGKVYFEAPVQTNYDMTYTPFTLEDLEDDLYVPTGEHTVHFNIKL
jgi:hypothetical protein